MKTYAVFCTLALYGQTQTPEPRPWTLPSAPAVKETGARAWRFTCDYHYLGNQGQELRRERISAVYTRDLSGGRVRWSDVEVAEDPHASGHFDPPAKRDFMQGFGYAHATAKDMLKPGFFRGFPLAAMIERNLVWDTHMFESFGEGHLADLKLDTPYHVPNSADVPLAGAGNFHHKDLQLIWTGLSQCAGQDCAVIDFRAFLNNVDVKLPGMRVSACSHYWGQVWVSTATRRIDHAVLYETVSGEVRLADTEKPRPVSVFRVGVFERIGK